MNINGASPIGSVFQVNDPAVTLRMNQRFSAEVIQISGQQVLLSVDGVPIVARMTTPDQAAALAERRTAQFIVKDLSGQIISLQLNTPETAQPTPASSLSGNLAAKLLLQAGLEDSTENLLIAQALLEHGLPVTSDLVNDLRLLLAKSSTNGVESHLALANQAVWGEADAQVAAALKAAGLPISPGALALVAQSEMMPVVELYKRLKSKLLQFSQDSSSQKVNNLLQEILGSMDENLVDWSASPEEIAENLRRSVQSLGRSIEYELSELIQDDKTSLESLSSGNPLHKLLMLRRELSREGSSPLIDEIDRFLDGLRSKQFMNADPVSKAIKEHWLSLDLPLGAHPPGIQGEQSLHESHLRIAYQPEESSNQLDLSRSCLVVQVDLDNGDKLEVSLSILDQRVGAHLTVSNQALQQRAEAGVPEFKDGLAKLGFLLQSFDCQIGEPSSTGLKKLAPEKNQFRPINVTI